VVQRAVRHDPDAQLEQGKEIAANIRLTPDKNPWHQIRTNCKGRFFTVFTYSVSFWIIKQMPTLKQEGPSSPKENMDAVVRHMNEKNGSSARQPCDQLFHTPSSSAGTGGRVFLMGSLSRRSNGQFSAQIAFCDPAKRPLRARAKILTRQNSTISSPGLPSRTIPLLVRQNLPSVSLRGPCRPAALSGRAIWPIVAPNPRGPSPLLSPPPSPWSSQWRGLRVVALSRAAREAVRQRRSSGNKWRIFWRLGNRRPPLPNALGCPVRPSATSRRRGGRRSLPDPLHFFTPRRRSCWCRSFAQRPYLSRA